MYFGPHLDRKHLVVGNVERLCQKRIHWSLQNHIGNYYNQFERIGQTRFPVASFIPTPNPEKPFVLVEVWKGCFLEVSSKEIHHGIGENHIKTSQKGHGIMENLSGGKSMETKNNRFRLHKSFIISMVVVGIGFFLISFVISKRGKLNANALEENQEIATIAARQFSNRAHEDKPIHKAQSESDTKSIDNEEIDEAIAWLESLESDDITREDAADEDETESVASAPSFEAQELLPELTLKIKQYAKLAEIMPLLRELDQTVERLCEETHVYGELFRKAHGPEQDKIDEIMIRLDAEIRAKLAKEEAYRMQVSEMFPALDLYEEDHDGYSFHVNRLVEYFGRELPWDGDPDYFQANLR